MGGSTCQKGTPRQTFTGLLLYCADIGVSERRWRGRERTTLGVPHVTPRGTSKLPQGSTLFLSFFPLCVASISWPLIQSYGHPRYTHSLFDLCHNPLPLLTLFTQNPYWLPMRPTSHNVLLPCVHPPRSARTPLAYRCGTTPLTRTTPPPHQIH